MPDGYISFPQPIKVLPVKDFPCKAVPFEVMKYSVAGNRNPSAFLAPVLQRVKPEIDIPGNRSFHRGPDSEHAAFLMHTKALRKQRGKGIARTPLPSPKVYHVRAQMYRMFFLSPPHMV